MQYFPVADDWCTAYICIDDNMYIVTIFGQRCRIFANVALTLDHAIYLEVGSI